METNPNELQPKSGIPSTNQHSRSEVQIYRDIRLLYQAASRVISKVSQIGSDEKKWILVVDCDPLTLEQIGKLLNNTGLDAEILTATSYQRALDIAVSVVPDMIIAEWHSEEGKDQLMQMKKNPVLRNIPIILIAGDESTESNEIKGRSVHITKRPLDREFTKIVIGSLARAHSFPDEFDKDEIMGVTHRLINFFIDCVPYAVFYQDKWGRFLGCNKKFEVLIERCREEIIGRMGDEFLPMPVAETLEVHFSGIQYGGIPDEFETLWPQDDGTLNHLIVSYIGIGPSSVEAVIGCITRASKRSPFEYKFTHPDQV